VSRVRIIGGAWRSRQIDVAAAPGLRPTPDRVRETLFNWLGQDLTGWACLDLFAGSGVLGLEAASRGADRVTLVEREARMHGLLVKATKTLQAAQVEVIQADAVKFCTFSSRRYDLVFLDPPYHQGWMAKMEPLLDGILKPEGWLYAEAEEPVERLGAWVRVKRGQAGQVHFQLLRRDEA
jgi:16S rRNA (guanine(966)-N(2))-methyltransferase RsmD